MTKVLLIDPALAVGMDRFRQTLPASVEIAATTSFEVQGCRSARQR